MDNVELWKISKIGDRKFEYNNTWEIEEFPDFKRVVVAPKENHVNLMLDLAKMFQGPYGILYDLKVPRVSTHEAGRYQSPDVVSFKEVETYCLQFKSYFETDARHDIWIARVGETERKEMIVYDQHNIIYVYGDVEQICKLLNNRGFTEGEVDIPVPHVHSYHDYNDQYETDMLNYHNWIHFPIQEEV
ncbi:hypothetical protein [Bacillus sp. S14(2024)]|uniref:hypothetical protein n=1 Tax=Bacillus sp. S14(2024) TaxID=3162884 RepID=UPI003D1C560C